MSLVRPAGPASRVSEADDQVGVFVTLDSIFPGEEASLLSLERLLKDLNKGEVIALCAHLNLFISDCLNEGSGSSRGRHFRKQWQIAGLLFDASSSTRIQRFFKQHSHSSLVFRGQLLELIRWAALYCRNEDPGEQILNNNVRREAFAKALLLVNGIWEKRIYRDQLAGTGDIVARRLNLLPRFRRSLSETEKGPDLTQAFVRGVRIVRNYLCIRCPDFARRFSNVSGLKLDDYFTCLMFLVMCSMGMNSKPPGTLEAKRFFNPVAEKPDLQQAINQLMWLKSQSVDELTSSLWKGGRAPNSLDVAILDHNIFRQRPILRFDNGQAIVMDPVFLQDMISIGPLFMSGDVETLRCFRTPFLPCLVRRSGTCHTTSSPSSRSGRRCLSGISLPCSSPISASGPGRGEQFLHTPNRERLEVDTVPSSAIKISTSAQRYLMSFPSFTAGIFGDRRVV